MDLLVRTFIRNASCEVLTSPDGGPQHSGPSGVSGMWCSAPSTITKKAYVMGGTAT